MVNYKIKYLKYKKKYLNLTNNINYVEIGGDYSAKNYNQFIFGNNYLNNSDFLQSGGGRVFTSGTQVTIMGFITDNDKSNSIFKLLNERRNRLGLNNVNDQHITLNVLHLNRDSELYNIFRSREFLNNIISIYEKYFLETNIKFIADDNSYDIFGNPKDFDWNFFVRRYDAHPDNFKIFKDEILNLVKNTIATLQDTNLENINLKRATLEYQTIYSFNNEEFMSLNNQWTPHISLFRIEELKNSNNRVGKDLYKALLDEFLKTNRFPSSKINFINLIKKQLSLSSIGTIREINSNIDMLKIVLDYKGKTTGQIKYEYDTNDFITTKDCKYFQNLEDINFSSLKASYQPLQPPLPHLTHPPLQD